MGDANPQMPGMKFMMLYMMPIMMIVWFNNYSAGLSHLLLLPFEHGYNRSNMAYSSLGRRGGIAC